MTSSSDRVRSTRAYDLLHPGVQRWVYAQQWTSLRNVQADAVEPVLGRRDLVIAAATASGKTEAAWLPIFSALASSGADTLPMLGDSDDELGTPGRRGAPGGVRALYLGPLKALINDQYLRLQSLGEYTDVPVHRWHGDVAASEKKKVRERPDGILLITPESLEAILVRQGTRAPAMFAALEYVVVDELHSFIGIERGAQLQSLLHRLELIGRRRVPRIGLSATLADLRVAADFLRPTSPGRASGPESGEVVIHDHAATESTAVKVQLRGYLEVNPAEQRATAARAAAAAASEAAPESNGASAGIGAPDGDVYEPPTQTIAIAEHLFSTLRGTDNLVFASSRSKVEEYADLLAKLSDRNRVPNEFLPHHGNLSKEFREGVEDQLRSTEQHATAVCTSTLEMGIDIGSTDSVAQLGAPGSVSSLRQRLGRSGRRGAPAVLRMYVTEHELDERTPPADQVRAQLFQGVAMTNLMLFERWYDPPNISDLHLSTLTQQVLSVIAQHSGATAHQLYMALCSRGPFHRVPAAMFGDLLRSMHAADLISLQADGLFLHGAVGEQLVNHYSFYTAFATSEEYRLMAGGRMLGSIPVDFPLLIGNLLIFAGRRWRVVDVDTSTRVIELARSSGGKPPSFSGGGAEVADVVRSRMRSLYSSGEVPDYLDSMGRELLAQGRSAFASLDLGSSVLYQWGSSTFIFAWRGDRIMNTMATALAQAGLKVGIEGVALLISEADAAAVRSVAAALVAQGPPDPVVLAGPVPNKERDKYDQYLSPELLAVAYAHRSVDVAGAWETFATIASESAGPQVTRT